MRFRWTATAASSGLVVVAFLTAAGADEAADARHARRRPEIVVAIGPRELVRPRDAMPFVMDSTLATLRRDAKTWFFYHSTDWGKNNEKFLGTPSDPFKPKSGERP
jgi:hypothetical protein